MQNIHFQGIWKLANREEGSWLVPTRYLYVLSQKCVVSSATESYHQVLVATKSNAVICIAMSLLVIPDWQNWHWTKYLTTDGFWNIQYSLCRSTPTKLFKIWMYCYLFAEIVYLKIDVLFSDVGPASKVTHARPLAFVEDNFCSDISFVF